MAHTFTAGGSAQIDTSDKKFGSGSGQFIQATSDWIKAAAHSDWNFGTGNFTIECWFNPSYNGFDILFSIGRDSTYRGLLFGFESVNHYPSLWWSNDGANWDINNTTFASSAPSQASWHHVAIVRDGNTIHCYIDGTEQGSGQDISSFNSLYFDASNSDLVIGAAENDDGSAGSFFNGAAGDIDEFRLSNIARYTGNFTPSASAFTADANTIVLLHMDGTDGSTTFTDDSAVAANSAFLTFMGPQPQQ